MNEFLKIIDNEVLTETENIDENLEKTDEKVALGILKTIDAQISNIDIDLAVDRETNKYYFIANNKNRLNISLNFDDLVGVGEILIKIFNNDIEISGDLHGRSIVENSFAFNETFVSTYEKSSLKRNFTKNEVEKLFVFAMNSQNIPMEDWELSGPICKGAYDNECKDDLG